MKSRRFSFKEDYKKIYDWWKGWGWKEGAIPLPIYLPPTGLIIENNGQDICSCFIYRTDTIWGILSWFLMNPKATKENRKGCLDFLIKEATKTAYQMGFRILDVMIDKESMIKRLENHGFERAELLTRVIKKL